MASIVRWGNGLFESFWKEVVVKPFNFFQSLLEVYLVILNLVLELLLGNIYVDTVRSLMNWSVYIYVRITHEFNSDRVENSLIEYVAHVPTKLEIIESGENCGICRRSYKNPQKLPCTHIFCKQCIVRWFQEETTCPYCRTKIYILNTSS